MCVLFDLSGLGKRNLVMCMFFLTYQGWERRTLLCVCSFWLIRVGKEEPCYVCVLFDLSGLGKRNLVMCVFSHLTWQGWETGTLLCVCFPA